jgi:HAD superfamily hydrolase (TIGR01490 family)
MSHDTPQPHTSRKHAVAVFDYDGTCIDGQSGLLISRWLLRKRYLSLRSAARLAWWGFRYKLHLPYREEQSRELIFHDLAPLEPDQIHRIMVDFHREVLLPLYRTAACKEITERKKEGCATVIVSATFDDIAREASLYLGTDGYVATQMERDENGHYTGNVLGEVITDKAKVEAVRRWADKFFGEESWDLVYAYGDHHSDINLLSEAICPVAVCPGPTLLKAAHKNDWPVANWEVG